MSDAGHAQELPPAYLPPAYVAPVSSLDQPALGLVFAIVALFGLPSAAAMFVQLVLLDRDLGIDVEIAVMPTLMLGATLLALVTGIAVAWQWRSRRVWCAAYLACGAGLVVASTVVLGGEGFGARETTVAILETLGGPLVVLAAPRLFGLRRIERSHALGGLLIASAIAIGIGKPPSLYDRIHIFTATSASLGSWITLAVTTCVDIALLVFELVAGLRMLRGGDATRWLAAYVITALVAGPGARAAGLIYLLVSSSATLGTQVAVATTAIGMVTATVRPLLFWFYAKRERELEPAAGVDAALPWFALWFAPVLFARCLIVDELRVLGGSVAFAIVVLAAVLGVANVRAARAGLRGERAVQAWTIAAVCAALLLATIVYFTHTAAPLYGTSSQGLNGPFVMLFAVPTAAAWLARRAAVARHAAK
ncbi:MAG TPA: hypothetical protein VFS15_24170 [Kofleriaceae bacterium]|nr:hypothetical protein [Kofleriaceae bacterium]